MKKLAALFTDSCREFNSLTTITVAAMVGALSIVLGYFTIMIGDSLKIGFATIANQFVYYLFGPVVGGVYGGAMDLIKYFLNPMGQPFFPGFTLNAMLAGVLYGSFFYKRRITIWRVLAAEFTVALICNVLLTTWWLSIMYGKGFMVLLPARLIKNVLMWPINSFLFYGVEKIMEESGVFRRVGKKGGAVL